MARMSSATSTKKADPTGPLRRSRPNRTPGGRRRAGMLSRRLYDGVGESLDHRGARTLLVVKPESPRELSSALTGRLEISTATTIRHSQPAELDLVEQGGRFSPRGPTRPLPLWTSRSGRLALQLSPRSRLSQAFGTRSRPLETSQPSDARAKNRRSESVQGS